MCIETAAPFADPSSVGAAWRKSVMGEQSAVAREPPAHMPLLRSLGARLRLTIYKHVAPNGAFSRRIAAMNV